MSRHRIPTVTTVKAALLRYPLAALVDCGLITRRDSPNGKRYARKDRGGDIEAAFGFSLAPLLARAHEFAQAAEALRLMRERITVHRRDIRKLIEAAVEEDVPGDWGGLWRRFRAVVDAIPRRQQSQTWRRSLRIWRRSMRTSCWKVT